MRYLWPLLLILITYPQRIIPAHTSFKSVSIPPKKVAFYQNAIVCKLLMHRKFIEYTHYTQWLEVYISLQKVFNSNKLQSPIASKRRIIQTIYEYLTAKAWNQYTNKTMLQEHSTETTRYSPFNLWSERAGDILLSKTCTEQSDGSYSFSIPQGHPYPYFLLNNGATIALVENIKHAYIDGQPYCMIACFDASTDDLLLINTAGHHSHYNIMVDGYSHDHPIQGKEKCIENHRVANGVYQKRPVWKYTVDQSLQRVTRSIETITHGKRLDLNPKGTIESLDKNLQQVLLPLRCILMNTGIRRYIPYNSTLAEGTQFDLYMRALVASHNASGVIVPYSKKAWNIDSADTVFPTDSNGLITYISETEEYRYRNIPPVILYMQSAIINKNPEIVAKNERSVSIQSDDTNNIHYYTLCAFISQMQKINQSHLIYFDLTDQRPLNKHSTPRHRHIELQTLNHVVKSDATWCQCRLIQHFQAHHKVHNAVYVDTDIIHTLEAAPKDAQARARSHAEKRSVLQSSKVKKLYTDLVAVHRDLKIQYDIHISGLRQALYDIVQPSETLDKILCDIESTVPAFIKKMKALHAQSREVALPKTPVESLDTIIIQQPTAYGKEHQAIVEKNNQLQGLIETFQKAQSTHLDTIRELQNTILEVTHERNTLQQIIAAQTQDISQAKVILTKFTETILQNIPSQKLDKIDKKRITLQQRTQRLRQQLPKIQSGYKNKIVKLKKQIKTLKAKNTQVQDTKITAHIADLTQQLATALSEKDGLNTTLTQLKTQHKEAISRLKSNHQTTLQNLRLSIDQQQRAIAEKNKLQEAFKTAESSHANTARQLQNTISAVTDERDTLRQQIIASQTQDIVLRQKKNNHILYSSLLSLGLLGSSAYFWRSHSIISMWAFLGASCLQSYMVISSIVYAKSNADTQSTNAGFEPIG